MVKQYETVFIMTPVLSDQQIKETVAKYKSILTDGGAEIVYEDDWGMRKLAYPIQKKSSGYYFLIEFKSEGELISKLETAYKRDETLLRFMTVALDKWAVAYNEKKRNGGLRKQQEAAKQQQEKKEGKTLSTKNDEKSETKNEEPLKD